jgi:hypothetical protein
MSHTLIDTQLTLNLSGDVVHLLGNGLGCISSFCKLMLGFFRIWDGRDAVQTLRTAQQYKQDEDSPSPLGIQTCVRDVSLWSLRNARGHTGPQCCL